MRGAISERQVAEGLLPDGDLFRADQGTLFALFMGVALSIAALPVIAKTLLDLGLFKTEIGLLVMTAAMVDDIAGWLAFSCLLGPMTGGAIAFWTAERAVLGREAAHPPGLASPFRTPSSKVWRLR